MAAGQNDFTGAMRSWWGEIKDFRCNDREAMKGKVVGHFTQMAWATTSRIGCGWAICDTPELKKYRGRFLVCNYGPT